MLESGVSHADFSIVPFPINFPELYRFYLPLDAVFYLTIYDDWGRRKLEMFLSLGINAEVLWAKSPEQKGASAREIRKHLAEGRQWEHLVRLLQPL